MLLHSDGRWDAELGGRLVVSQVMMVNMQNDGDPGVVHGDGNGVQNQKVGWCRGW